MDVDVGVDVGVGVGVGVGSGIGVEATSPISSDVALTTSMWSDVT